MEKQSRYQGFELELELELERSRSFCRTQLELELKTQNFGGLELENIYSKFELIFIRTISLQLNLERIKSLENKDLMQKVDLS